MFHQLNFKVFLGVSTGLLMGIGSATAHNLTITEDIAGTWHIEPNHAPKAGEPARVWVALTRRGGELLSLDQANCSLGVYQVPRSQGDEPILRPAIQAIGVEQYQGVPGADVIFPETGRYQLDLDCNPKIEGAFTPFQMQYDVTVASAGIVTPKTQSPFRSKDLAPTATTNQTALDQSSPIWVQILGMGMGIIAVMLIIRLAWQFMRKRQ